METGSDNRASSRSLNSEINVTPLVDVMLVVLIIFMVVTPMLQGSIPVDLPGARNLDSVTGSSADVVTVVLQKSGGTFVGRLPVSEEELLGTLQEFRQADPNLRLQIQADRAVLYGRIKRVLDAGRAAGFPGATMAAREWDPGDAARESEPDAPARQVPSNGSSQADGTYSESPHAKRRG